MRLAVIIAICIVGGSLVFADGPATPAAPVNGPTTQIIPPNDMFNRLLNRTGPTAQPLVPQPNPSPLDKTTGAGATPPNAPQLNLRREGSYINDRMARLSKSNDGQQWELTLEADGKAMQDPPLVVLPNMKLETMENAITQSNRDLKFHVSGMITEYKSRNYILLEYVQVVADAQQQF